MCVFILISSMLLVSCGGSKPPIIELDIAYHWEANDMTRNAAWLCSGVYNDMVYYVQDLPTDFKVRFLTFEGKEVRSISIKKGKGPGEAISTLGIRIFEDTIYFSDMQLARISIFTIDGTFKESIEFDQDSGLVVSLDYCNGPMAFQSLTHTKLGLMDMKTGKIIKSIKSSVNEANYVGTELNGGVTKYDPLTNHIYVGNLSLPYRIDVYDMDLQKLKTITYDLDGNYRPAKLVEGPDADGDMIVSSISVDEKHIYATKIGARYNKFASDFKQMFDEYSGEILMFNKETGKTESIFTCALLKNIRGFFTIIGITDTYIVVHMMGAGDYTEAFYKTKSEDFHQTIVVLKRP